MMNRRIRQHVIKLLLLVCLLPYGCKDKSRPSDEEQETVVQKEFSQGLLTVKLTLNADQILLSDLLSVDMIAVIEPGYELVFPEMTEALGDFRIQTWEDKGRKLLADGKIQINKQYHLEPLRAGELVIPPLAFQFYKQPAPDTQPDRLTLETEAIAVSVTTTLSGDLSEVSITDIEDVVEMKRDFSWVWITVIALLVFAAGAVAFRRLRPKKAEQVHKSYKPAHEIALERIRMLAAQKLIERGRVKEFYGRLSNCLRRYIENRFSLRAPEQTTEEFLYSLKDSTLLESGHKEELKKFLEHCDLVKFARFQPTPEQNDQSIRMAEQFVLNTKSEERLVEVHPNGEGK